ncbi:MAG: winged helix-turn-helix transcriptional regulator [Chromatiales bacterium]|nr:winged helix-turn-helix transcriptional regulator [Chromatiales bacterium]
MSAAPIHDTLERLCMLLRVEARVTGSGEGLLPVQIEALHYLARCNRYSDTVQGLTGFLNQTKGTVSQTVKVLESRGLIEKRADANDGRVSHLLLTDKGRALIAEAIPPHALSRGISLLPADTVTALTDGLAALLQATQTANDFKTFAACHSCRFNQQDGDGHRCGLTGEALSGDDIRKICREHQYPDTERRDGASA